MNEAGGRHSGSRDAEANERRRRDRRRAAARRAARRRRGALVAAVALACICAAVVVAVSAGQSAPAPAARAPETLARAAARNPSAAHGRHAPAASQDRNVGAAGALRSHGPPPGALPQTNRLPSSRTAQFRSEMAALWAAIATGRWRLGVPAFFPKGAYLQVKAIAGAGEDFDNRLLGGFRLDIGAAHALLGAGVAGAQLIGVRVPSRYGHWVTPGVCYNRIGYWEVPNSRVVYRERGAVRSFGIASMISWRGVWYVVHLGSVLRPSEHGYLDAPSAGPGVSEYSSTC